VIESLLAFVAAIGVLVTVHEFGHFWVARRLGVKVLRFSIGFGRPLLTWHRRGDETEYCLAAIPLGGYVKMLDEAEGEVAPAERARAFNRQPLAVRVAVVTAGPLANFAFALLAYWLMFLIGVSGLRAMVGGVSAESLAAQAGLRAGDQILAVAGRPTRSWDGVVQALVGAALGSEAVTVEVRGADGARRRIELSLAGVAIDELTRGRLFARLGLEPQRPRVVPVIERVEPGSPAELGGLRPGDRVIAAGGEPITDWSEWVARVRAHPGRPLATVVERAGARVELLITPEAVPDERDGGLHGRIGAAVRTPAPEVFDALYVTERYGPLEAAVRAAARTEAATVLTLRMVWKMLTAQVSVENLSGPISIAQYAGISVRFGAARFLEFLAIVSVSLGILNLLPIPLLDGGHLLYYALELVRGRPLSEQARDLGQRLGIAVLVGLMGIAFYNDLARLLG